MMLEKILQLNTWLVYALLFAIAFIGAWLLMQLAKGGQKVTSAKSRKKQKSRLGCLTVIFLILVFLCLLFFTAYLRAYQAFTGEELVAVVEIEPADQTNASFILNFTPVKKGQRDSTIQLPINGDQWVVGGDIVRWKDAFTFLGLKSMYRLYRVEGQYLQGSDTKEKPSVHFVGKGGDNTLWNQLYKIGNRIFFVSGVFGAKVFNYPSYNSYFEIYVTEDGFVMKKFNKDQRSLTRKILDSVLESDQVKNEEMRR